MAPGGNALDAVIFDVDGTLVDSVDLHARCWRQAFAHFGKELELQTVRSQIGKGGDQLLPVFLDHYEMNRFGKELDEYRSRLWKRSSSERVVAFPKVRELFLRIRRDGIRIAVASSSKEDELGFYLNLCDVETLVDVRISATLRREGCIAIYVDPADLLQRYDDSPLRIARKYREGTAFEEIVP